MKKQAYVKVPKKLYEDIKDCLKVTRERLIAFEHTHCFIDGIIEYIENFEREK